MPTRFAKISSVGVQTDAGLTCPRCGGTQFKARRTGLQRLFGVLTLVTLPLMPKKQVQCETCGAKFRRG